jgi:hypothetical protein
LVQVRHFIEQNLPSRINGWDRSGPWQNFSLGAAFLHHGVHGRRQVSSSIAVEQQVEAFSARDGGSIVGGDALHFGAMGGFLVAGVAQHHAVFIEGVPVTFLPSIFTHRGSSEGML